MLRIPTLLLSTIFYAFASGSPTGNLFAPDDLLKDPHIHKCYEGKGGMAIDRNDPKMKKEWQKILYRCTYWEGEKVMGGAERILDPKRGLKLLRTACLSEGGEAFACEDLAKLYARSDSFRAARKMLGIGIDYEKAFEYAKVARNLGGGRLAPRYAGSLVGRDPFRRHTYLESLGKHDTEDYLALKAKAKYWKLCKENNATGCLMAARDVYDRSYGGLEYSDSNFDKGLLKRACELKSGEGCYRYAETMKYGLKESRYTREEKEQGYRLQQTMVDLYAKSCNLGFHPGCDATGWMILSSARQSPAAWKAAYPWFRKACGLGDPDGCLQAGFYTLNFLRNPGGARPYYRKACELGADPACRYYNSHFIQNKNFNRKIMRR